jgi:hypothetical protein
MGETYDYSRQRLADFFAARLKARRAETNDPKPTKRDSRRTTLPHTEQNPAHTAKNADSSTKEPSLSEQKRHPITGLGSSD